MIFDPTGVAMQACDADQIGFVDFVWKKPSFQEYSCTIPGCIIINPTQFLKVLRMSPCTISNH
jgi:hypothetical protein